VIASAIYWELMYKISFRFVQIRHFCCTMSMGLLFSQTVYT